LDISELLEKFRSVEYHYPDVVWHDVRLRVLRPILTEKLVDFTPEDFEELLRSDWFMWPRVIEQTLQQILGENDFNEVKLRLLNLFLGKGSIEKRLQDVLNLRGIGVFLASQFLSAVDEDYIIYHRRVLEGIRELLPHLDDWGILPENVKTAEGYLRFNDICRSIRDRFGFKSLGEVHEFFWHGHEKNWQFNSNP